MTVSLTTAMLKGRSNEDIAKMLILNGARNCKSNTVARRLGTRELTHDEFLSRSRNTDDSSLHPRKMGNYIFGSMPDLENWIHHNLEIVVGFIIRYETEHRTSVLAALRELYTGYGYEQFDALLADAFMFALARTLEEVYPQTAPSDS
jgi:hypothetical protein